ncbi:PilW family protein [Cytobacillus sp. NCCP-133]|uniref:PilW family protein n=1 Tax=Cytobacillus sp. NCCP-133 TaxID=766848 RepID=UPI00222E3355|nr:prepilin-type N-terminal cleavage/methylation domain-containing protein [Cytobacillus sp. NCCP-133]GLB58380.1 hypothetical protein NCCP133_05130 [Cytobacillus sp. NCCP-133]
MNQKGVTLIELLVTVTIMSAVLSVSILLVNVALKSEQEVTVKNELQREARFIAESVTEKIRDGVKASYDAEAGKIVFSDGRSLAIETGNIDQFDLSPKRENVYDLHLILNHSDSPINYELNTEIVISERFRY